ncbi:MAG: Outer membrane lipoprotein, OmpA/SmpA/OmlA family [candidate division TM6 bacterium GW2011_GWF2_28_16]|jgi:outer membrane protein OmpA-like peptidoglycan-associated protein|nr:MAG: Outer membrane lipoprotein, OmpA/SmpA/OmlA family [candidate division TM6 bacterium GW2011_GWF2_28_16]
MIKFRDLAVACSLVFALLMSGCGKKKDKVEQKKIALNNVGSNQKMASAVIPVASEEIEDFFVEDASTLAFADDDVISEDSAKLSQIDIDKSLVGENAQEDESSFVAWNEEEVQELNFKTVHFDFDKNDIRNDQVELVKQDIDAAKTAIAEGKTVVVQGHTCAIGSPSYNIALSERRADVIKKEMINNGVPAENIKAIGYGPEVPVVWSEKVDKQELIKELAPNRRVEITVS